MEPAMDFETACAEFEAGNLKDVVIEPADEGNGWMLLVHKLSGEVSKITDHGGTEKIYHSIDHATQVAKDIGFDEVRVEEQF